MIFVVSFYASTEKMLMSRSAELHSDKSLVSVDRRLNAAITLSLPLSENYVETL